MGSSNEYYLSIFGLAGFYMLVRIIYEDLWQDDKYTMTDKLIFMYIYMCFVIKV